MKETIKQLDDPFASEPMDAKNHFYKSDYSRNWGNARYIVVFTLLGLIFLMMFLIIFVLHLQGQQQYVDCVSVVSHREISYQSINKNGKPVNVTGYLFSIDEDNVNTKRHGLVWNHGAWNTTSDKNTLCELARLGYVVFGPNFQGGKTGEPDYLGTQIEDSLRALNFLKKYRQTSGMNIYMGGEGNGASVTLLAIQRLRRLSSFDVPKVALKDITYNPIFQIYNTMYLEHYSRMFAGLGKIYGLTQQKVIDNIIIPRSPSLAENQQFLADVSVLITAARNNEIINFANSNQLAGDLQEISVPHKLISYDTEFLDYNGTVLNDWLNDVSQYLK